MDEEKFIDILSDRRNTSDLAWALKSWNKSTCQFSLERSPQQIKQSVLNNKRLKIIISEISKEENCTEKQIEKKASEILNEMSHNFQFRTIRFFGFALSKFMKSIYEKILVNEQGLDKIASISKDYPILYLPTHRSYSDFLLVSYVCFYFNLPVPVIAAGQDFLGLKYLSFLLRGAGAFFIRRSFAGDKLYKEIFSAYVQTHIEGAEFPLEFFIEGTRSRTAKSLVPKLGMLQVILEMFFSSKVPDITIVPISITYDRTLEEALYAYELLGVPKPKESTKGLIQARKVMSDNYGNVFVKFAEPVSLKEYFYGYDRSVHNLHPRNLSTFLKDEHRLCADLANDVICMQLSNSVLSPFPLICLVLSQTFLEHSGGVHFNDLLEHFFWMQRIIKKNGVFIYIGNNSPSKALMKQLELHSNILKLSEDFYISLKDGIIQHPSSSSSVSNLQDNTVKCAIPAMFSYHYGNQALSSVAHVCMLCLSIACCEESVILKSDIFLRYEILRNLLRREFVFKRHNSEENFSQALDSLVENDIICINALKIMPLESNFYKLKFLSKLLLPFLQSYHIICQHFIQVRNKIPSDMKALSLECQAKIESAIIHGFLMDYRCLSLDIVNNCITFLVNEGALSKIIENKSIYLVSCHSRLTNILIDLEMFLYPHKRSMNTASVLSLPPAKL